MIDVSEHFLAALLATTCQLLGQEITEKLEQAQLELRQASLDLPSERGQRRNLQSRVEDLQALTVSRFR